MHHENSIPDRDYPNATQFKLELNGTRVDYLYDMVIPPNRHAEEVLRPCTTSSFRQQARRKHKAPLT